LFDVAALLFLSPPRALAERTKEEGAKAAATTSTTRGEDVMSFPLFLSLRRPFSCLRHGVRAFVVPRPLFFPREKRLFKIESTETLDRFLSKMPQKEGGGVFVSSLSPL
jgi:hypothetical protein